MPDEKITSSGPTPAQQESLRTLVGNPAAVGPEASPLRHGVLQRRSHDPAALKVADPLDDLTPAERAVFFSWHVAQQAAARNRGLDYIRRVIKRCLAAPVVIPDEAVESLPSPPQTPQHDPLVFSDAERARMSSYDLAAYDDDFANGTVTPEDVARWRYVLGCSCRACERAWEADGARLMDYDLNRDLVEPSVVLANAQTASVTGRRLRPAERHALERLRFLHRRPCRVRVPLPRRIVVRHHAPGHGCRRLARAPDGDRGDCDPPPVRVVRTPHPFLSPPAQTLARDARSETKAALDHHGWPWSLHFPRGFAAQVER